MTSILYFAYGSNMLAARLQARCPSARVCAVARADGYGISFAKKGRDGSGKATLVASNDVSSRVFGVVFDLNSEELASLDRFEGRGHGYDRIDDLIVYTEPDQRRMQVTTYIANPDFVDRGLQPYDWYLALVLAGARQNSLPTAYIDILSATPTSADSESNRPEHIEARKLLA